MKVFRHNLIKEILCAYGYEMTLSGLAQEFRCVSKTRTGIVRRIRNFPDLLVYNTETEQLMLVEVKIRNAPNENKVLIKRGAIEPYQKYWRDAFL